MRCNGNHSQNEQRKVWPQVIVKGFTHCASKAFDGMYFDRLKILGIIILV